MTFANTIEEALAILADPDETELNCYGIGFGPEEAKQIAEMLPRSKVITLRLNNNRIGDEGIAHIARALPESQIKGLELNNNSIGDEGAAHIAKALQQSGVRLLFLAHNNIGNKGAMSIARVLPESQLLALWLNHNDIGKAGVAQIVTSVPLSPVLALSLHENTIDQAQIHAIDIQLNTTKDTVSKIVQLLRENSGKITPELWRDISRFPVEAKWTLGARSSLVDFAFQSALKQGFPVQEFLLRTRPTKEAIAWLKEHNQPIPKVDDLLASDLSLPEENHYAAARLVSIPDAWESKAQAVHVRKQLPEALRELLPWQELYLALNRRTQITETQR